MKLWTYSAVRVTRDVLMGNEPDLVLFVCV
jgi:hypothetical protein